MLQGQPRPDARRRRAVSHATRLGVGVASLALVVGGAVSNSLSASAQDDATPTESAIAPYDPAKWVNGEGAASADTFRFNITQGNADIGYSLGTVLATFRDRTGRSDSRALDLGVFPTLYGVPQCDGSPPLLNPATFPPKTIADSNEAGSDVPKPGEAYLPGFKQGGPGAHVGTQVATATKLPSSQASTVSKTADMFFIVIKDGQSEATTSVRDNVREARAVVTAKELRIMNDLFVFKDPRWEAVAQSGRVTNVSGSFTFRKAYVLGSPRSPEQALKDLNEFRKGLEDLLRPLGAKLEMPKVIVEDNRVKVTPMSFKLVDAPFGKELIRPLLNNLQEAREEFVRQQLAADCRNETNLMLGDLILSILSGSGTLEIHAGGVDAWTDDTDFTVPEPAPVEPPKVLAGTPEVMGTAGTPDEDYSYEIPGEYVAGTPGYDYGDYGDYGYGTDDDLGPVDDTTPPVTTPKVVKKTKKSTDPARLARKDQLVETKGGTAAVAVGLAGLLGAIGLTFGEHLRERRTRRRIP